MIDGSQTNTAFYWSDDNVYDIGDLLINNVNENAILSGDTLISTINIVYPVPISQIYYYLFYVVDGTNNLLESDENDNIGSFKIVFDYVNSFNDLNEDQINVFVYEGKLVVDLFDKQNNGKYNLMLINSVGQTIFNKTVNIEYGRNDILLPMSISNGIYITRLFNEKNNFITKFYIQN